MYTFHNMYVRIYIRIYFIKYVYMCISSDTYICSPPPQDLCFDIAVRQIRHTQQKHVRAIFSVENIAVMVRHRQELYLSRDG